MTLRIVGLRCHHTIVTLRLTKQSTLYAHACLGISAREQQHQQHQQLSVQEAYRRFGIARSYSTAATAKESNEGAQSSPPSPPQPQGSKKVRRWMTRRLFEALLWVPVVAFVSLNLGTVGVITGQSMSPTFNSEPPHKTVVFINRYAAGTVQYAWSRTTPKKQNLKVGDVVIMRSPLDPRLVVTKRILALPGDIITRRGSLGNTSNNDNKGQEGVSRVLIPPGHMWVEGDASVGEYHDKDAGDASHLQIPSNIKSRDSRTFGPVPMGLAFGRIDYILHPISQFGPVPGRPNFDAVRANEMRHARHRNENPISIDMQTRRAHPNDSAVSPYSDWEWVVNTRTSERNQASAEEEEEEGGRSSPHRSSNRASRSGKSRRDDDFETIWRDQLNRLSRGGQLGHHQDNDKD